jgi:hypothetical protein
VIEQVGFYREKVAPEPKPEPEQLQYRTDLFEDID